MKEYPNRRRINNETESNLKNPSEKCFCRKAYNLSRRIPAIKA
jgi:hypothetical protein